MVHAKYRWMLTGTPVTNTLCVNCLLYLHSYCSLPAPSADIYGLLRFGRFRPWNDWDDFNRYIVRCPAVPLFVTVE